MARLQGKSTKKSHKKKDVKPTPPPVQSSNRLERLVCLSAGVEKKDAWLSYLECRYTKTKAMVLQTSLLAPMHFERWVPTVPTYLRGEEVVLYHGTSLRNFATVLLKGFQPGRSSCLFGRGIYLASMYKAMGYSRSENTEERELGFGVLFKCAVNLGKVYEAAGPLNACPEGFDTVYGKAGKTKTRVHSRNLEGLLQVDEYCVYDTKRIRILEVLIRRDSLRK